MLNTFNVEVFIIQLEGKKTWHISKNIVNPLPETYSSDLTKSDPLLNNMKEIVLSPGDILYMPRGTVHEAITQNEFSIHVTLSMYQ